MIKRGDIVFVDLPGSTEHVQGSFRPWLVVQNDKGNYYSPTTIVVPITTAHKKPLPTHVDFIWGSVFGTILTEQIRVIDQSELVKASKIVECLPEKIMMHVDRALAVAVGLEGIS